MRAHASRGLGIVRNARGNRQVDRHDERGNAGQYGRDRRLQRHYIEDQSNDQAGAGAYLQEGISLVSCKKRRRNLYDRQVSDVELSAALTPRPQRDAQRNRRARRGRSGACRRRSPIA